MSNITSRDHRHGQAQDQALCSLTPSLSSPFPPIHLSISKGKDKALRGRQALDLFSVGGLYFSQVQVLWKGEGVHGGLKSSTENVS